MGRIDYRRQRILSQDARLAKTV
ncbi:uncharacterized protein G2W53_031484 [Senna tora]|uniref:Uncharacterized protein n=1 Tax=Senna tora TaxID=362788 RepID=A0A834T9C0_9FABA|nr:uncharacterized protein G2W53_031484 [Senna tora]